MKRSASLVLGTLAVIYGASTAAIAQNAPPSYQADPDVYKIIFEDQNFRVISGTWKKGAHDKPHSHPVPSVIYPLTDCHLKLTAADGKTADANNKAGVALAAPVTPSHSAENVGPADCRVIFVERK